MADNPRYQRQNIMLAETQPLQFADIKESVASSRSLQLSLDRISEFAFKQATETAKEKGMQYAIDNPITVEQAMRAIDGGIDASTLPIQGSTVFDETARKVQAKLLRTDLALEARGELSNISARIKAGIATDLNEIESDINGVLNGYGKALRFDPEESTGFRADISQYGAIVKQQAADHIAGLAKAENIATVNQAIEKLETELEDKLKFLEVKDPAQWNLLSQSSIASILAKARQTGPENYSKVLEQTNKIKTRVENNAIADYMQNTQFARNMTEAVIKVRKGIADDFTQILAGKSKDEVKNIIKIATDKASEDFTLIQAQQKLDMQLKEEEAGKVLDAHWSGEIGATADVTLGRLEAIGYPVTLDLRKQLKTTELETPAKEKAYGKIEELVDLNQIGAREIDAYASSNVITYKQANSLKKRGREVTTKYKDGFQIIRNEFNIPDAFSALNATDKVKGAVGSAQTQLILEAEQALKERKPFNVVTRAKEIASEVKKVSTSSEEQAAKDALSKALVKFKITDVEKFITDFRPSDVDQSDVFEDANEEIDIPEIKRNLNTIRKIRGMPR
jgi:hypothetical protein